MRNERIGQKLVGGRKVHTHKYITYHTHFINCFLLFLATNELIPKKEAKLG